MLAKDVYQQGISSTPGVPSAMPEVYPWVYNNVYHRHWSHNMFLRVTAVVQGLEVYH